MAIVTSYPYHQPRPERIQVVNWQVSPSVMEDGITLRDWDPSTPIEISCALVCDHAGILEDTRLAAGCEIGLALGWLSEGNGLRGCGPTLRLLASSEPAPVVLELGVPPGKPAARLRIVATACLLEEVPHGRAEASPHLAGSVLWRDQRVLCLEGTAARFPVEVADFAQVGWLPANASWHLDWDPSAPGNLLLRSLRLRINSANQRVANAVASPRSRDPETRAILSMIYHDVGRSLIEGMLQCAEFVEVRDPFERGTIGHHVAALLRRHFPGEAASSLAARLRTRPEEFRAELQSRLGLLAYTIE